MKILMTGGSGLLGTEIRKLDQKIICPTHEELDVTDLESVTYALKNHVPDVVLHLAAYTKPLEHTNNPDPGILVNIIGTANVALACHRLGIRLVYTSTDYLYVGKGPHKEDEPILPPYKFGWSKLGGECAVRMLDDSLILRLSFGTVPYQWDKVYKDQYNSKLYVDEIAPLVLAVTKCQIKGVINIGGPRTSLEEYARRSKPNIDTIPKPDWTPEDTSLDITRMKEELNISNEFDILKR